jgi:olefin beta-lactone synthetase
MMPDMNDLIEEYVTTGTEGVAIPNAEDKVMTDSFNIAAHLRQMAQQHPYKRAVIFPFGRNRYNRVTYTHLTFQQLDRESDKLAFGLEATGIGRGIRTVLMVKPCLEFFVLVYALFKTGAIPVVVDPGMGIGRMIRCLGETKPRAFIGIPLAHVIRILFPKYFGTVYTAVTVGRRWFWRGETYESLCQKPWMPYELAQTQKSDTAAILFTTGSTGPAKGVIYTHGTFDAQIQSIRNCFDIGENEIDLPTFPLFALFDPALGMTAVIPDMNPTRPAFVNPERIIEAIENQGVTNLFASPALLNRVGRYGEENLLQLPTLKRVVSAGAPVSMDNIARFSTLLVDEAQIFTPYGATEAMPVTCIGSHEILSETGALSEKGFGICVGRPVEGVEVKIIKISDDPIEALTDDLLLPDDEIGEIIVQGDVVTREYYKNPPADALGKIQQGDRFWHRMGDLAWRDKTGRIWYCGRKNHRVETELGPLYTIPCEAIFNRHPSVARSALVGVGPERQQTPVMCIELHPEAREQSQNEIAHELLSMAQQHILVEDIQTILFHKKFPVDIRHNSKIFREKLAIWASGKVKNTA